jgi:hypothetical protein
LYTTLLRFHIDDFMLLLHCSGQNKEDFGMCAAAHMLLLMMAMVIGK